MILGAAKSSAGEFVEGIQITLYEVLIATAIAVTLGTSLGALLGATGLGAKASANRIGSSRAMWTAVPIFIASVGSCLLVSQCW
jgi:ABC-type nitrate/sulfonate/bicarbonate transport system permease component